MTDAPDFEELTRLEPRLAELEQRARDATDDGSATFFCSNYLWLPLYTKLRDVVGAYRRAGPEEAREGPLFDAGSFEKAFLHLSRLLPPCRACGCRIFEPVREKQLRELGRA